MLTSAAAEGRRTSLTACLPNGPFTISEPENRSIGELYVVRNCGSTDFEALELCRAVIAVCREAGRLPSLAFPVAVAA